MKKIALLVAIFVLIAGVGAAIVGPRYITQAAPQQSSGDVSGQLSAGPLCLGIVIANLSPELAQRLGLEQEEGVVILRILPGSPAKEAGLEAKDIITHINGAPVSTVDEVTAKLGEAEVGDEVTVRVLRGEESQDIAVVAGDFEPFPKGFLKRGPRLRAPFGAAPLPRSPILEDLEGIPADERFEHFLGWEMKLTDKDGQPYTIQATPGVVVSVTESSLIITPNDLEASTTFTVNGDTLIRKGRRMVGLEELEAGDRVVVITRGGSESAKLILVGCGAAGFWLKGAGFSMPRAKGACGLESHSALGLQGRMTPDSQASPGRQFLGSRGWQSGTVG